MTSTPPSRGINRKGLPLAVGLFLLPVRSSPARSTRIILFPFAEPTIGLACVARGCGGPADPKILGMALKPHSELLFFSEIADSEDVPFPTNEFYVGLYIDAALPQILRCERSRFVRFGRWLLGRSLDRPTPVLLAAALVRQKSGALLIRNVGAEKGYGPLLYASVLHLARARGRMGVIPSQDPSKILAKPKNIWRKFATDDDYTDKVALTAFDGRHAEPWLNMIYSLRSGQDLISFDDMRSRTRSYWGFWQSRGFREASLAEHARELAALSVKAHQAVSESVTA